jgi:hypothetical protein
MPTPNTIVVGGSGGGGGDGYPTLLVSTAAELTGALTSLNGVGGIICLMEDITLNASVNVPGGVLLLGKYGAEKLTLGPLGILNLLAKSEIRDLKVVSGKTSGNLVTMPDTRAVVRTCFFQVNNANAVTCIRVTGSYNRILQNTFTGVIGVGPAVGIEFAAGADNVDQDSFFE